MTTVPTTFYNGPLQEGIAHAVTHNLPVVVFATSTDDESQMWEHSWLQAVHTEDDAANGLPPFNLPRLLTQSAVTLRVLAGTQDVAFLHAFCPLERFPTLVVIKNGVVVEKMEAGVGKEELVQRLLAALDQPTTTTSEQSKREDISTRTSSRATTRTSEDSNRSNDARRRSSPQPPATSTEASADASVAEQQGSRPSTNPARARRSPPSIDTTNRPPSSQGQAQSDTQQPTTPRIPLTPSQQTYAEERRQRKKGAEAERERIRGLIEADKKARRARAQQERAQRRAAATGDTGESDLSSQEESTRPTVRRTYSAKSSSCAIQVRLLNGNTIRKHFDASTTVRNDIRAWIDSARTDGEHPYKLRVILTPDPSRALGDTDEELSLEQLGLTPSAALALVPVKNLAEAYQTAGTRGFLRGGPALLWRYILGFLGWLFGFVGTFLGLGVEAAREVESKYDDSIPRLRKQADPAAAKAEDEPPPRNTRTDGARVNIRTLQDQQREAAERARDKQQLYNGNQLNFEPGRHDHKDHNEDQTDTGTS